MNRRTVLIAGASALLVPSTPLIADDLPKTLEAPFSAETVIATARDLATRPHALPVLPPNALRLGPIGYDQYRDITFKHKKALFRDENLGFEVQFFPAAYLYTTPVDIMLVENGHARPLVMGPEMWTWGPLADTAKLHATIPLSGLRIHYPLNKPDFIDDLVVFQGASYFRALGRGHAYGLSARGLALRTVFGGGEEFPNFTRFWIERPASAREIIVHALLDSPSVTGAYRFAIRPEGTTVMNVAATLFPRVDLDNVGLAPLTSMFLYEAHDQADYQDFRPAVHDSDGLAIRSASGARTWRPLLNPKALQVSRFPESDPAGFGLMQREQGFAAYQDLEARYERRPSAWVEPQGDWGRGEVELVELATREEYYDNIVVYWRPGEVLKAGARFDYAYRLSWCFDTPAPETRFRVAKTRIGLSGPLSPNIKRFIIDFTDTQPRSTNVLAREHGVTGERLGSVFKPIYPRLTASAGRVGEAYLRPNPEIDGLRVSFDLEPQGHDSIDLRLNLEYLGAPASETWVFRSFL